MYEMTQYYISDGLGNLTEQRYPKHRLLECNVGHKVTRTPRNSHNNEKVASIEIVVESKMTSSYFG